MLSNKWTFSLTCLVVLFALGFAVAPVMAAHTSSDRRGCGGSACW